MPWGTSNAASTTPATRSPWSHDRRYRWATANPGIQRSMALSDASGIAFPADTNYRDDLVRRPRVGLLFGRPSHRRHDDYRGRAVPNQPIGDATQEPAADAAPA